MPEKKKAVMIYALKEENELHIRFCMYVFIQFYQAIIFCSLMQFIQGGKGQFGLCFVLIPRNLDKPTLIAGLKN